MEHNPSSSSLFLNMPQVDGNEDGDCVLPYISRMLMEENIVDKFLHQHPDHPALVQAQQLFTNILSDASSDVLAAQPCKSVELSSAQSSAPAPHHSSDVTTPASTVQSGPQVNNTQDPSSVVNGAAADTVEPNSLLPAASSSSSYMDAVSEAFFKGMEEANKFLPGDGVAAGGGRGQKKRLDGDDKAETGAGRSSKQMASDGEESEEAAVREMLDQLMLSGCEPSVAEMQELRATMEVERTPRRRRGTSAGQAVDLHTMLIRCAEAVANDDRRVVANLLERIRRHSSPAGDGTQRLAHYFAEGLEARVAGTGSRRYRSFLMVKRGSLANYLKASRLYMTAFCFIPVIFLFSSKTIYSAVAGRKKLHIVHYGLSLGLQWPELLRQLAHREGGPPEVRLTGIDIPEPGFRPARLIEETGRRLSDCARQLGVPFKFRGIAARSEAVRADDLDIDPDEVLVVNSIFHFRSLMDEGVTVDGANTNTMDMVLATIREMRPSVFIHAIVNASYNTAFFATRFREALNNFTALFDVMDTLLPRDNDKRLLFERDILGQCAVNVIACEGVDRVQRPRSYKQWQARSQRAGLRQLPLDRGIVRMLKDKVKEYHKCFEISEDQQWLLQGWKGRVLYAFSTWTAGDDLA